MTTTIEVSALSHTTPPEPGAGRGALALPLRLAGMHVSEETALQVGTVWACVRVISEDLAALPWHVLRRREAGGKDYEFLHPVDWLLDVQANPETTAQAFRETLLAHALLWGNGYAEVERDVLGRPLWLWQLTPDRVTPLRDRQSGEVVYRVHNHGAEDSYIPAADMFHLKGLGFDGLVGYSPIRVAARTIAAAAALDEFVCAFFANDGTPGGVLKHPGVLGDKARLNLEKAWLRRHRGPSRKREVAVLEEGMDWVQTGTDPNDLQLFEQRQITPAEICRIFRVSPYKVQDLLRATFGNVEEINLNHVPDTLMPWGRRLESEANVKLFGRNSRGTLVTKINYESRLKGNSAARTAAVTAFVGNGIWSVDEAREYLGYNPLPGGIGRQHYAPLNMGRLEQPATPAPAPTPPPTPAPEAPAAPPAQMRAMLRPVALATLKRVGRRVLHTWEKVKGRWDAEARLAPLWEGHAAYAAEELAPLLGALGRDRFTVDLTPLQTLPEAEPDWDGWAAAEAERLLTEVPRCPE